MQWTK